MLVYYMAGENKVLIDLFMGYWGPVEMHKEEKKYMEMCRKIKRADMVFSPPEKLDPKDIEKALKIIMMN